MGVRRKKAAAGTVPAAPGREAGSLESDRGAEAGGGGKEDHARVPSGCARQLADTVTTIQGHQRAWRKGLEDAARGHLALLFGASDSTTHRGRSKWPREAKGKRKRPASQPPLQGRPEMHVLPRPQAPPPTLSTSQGHHQPVTESLACGLLGSFKFQTMTSGMTLMSLWALGLEKDMV